MPTKTVYLSAEDLAFIDANAEILGDNLSAALMEGLRLLADRREAQSAGFEEVKFNVGERGRPQMKSFKGRLLARVRELEEDGKVTIARRIYATPKHAYVYVERRSVNWDYWTKAGDNDVFDLAAVEEKRVFEVSDTLEALVAIAGSDLVNAALSAEADADKSLVEYLDI